MIGVPFCQFLKHQINGILKFLIVLPDLHGVDELNKGGEVLLLHRGLIVDKSDEGAVQQGLSLGPKFVTALLLPLCVGNQGCYQL